MNKKNVLPSITKLRGFWTDLREAFERARMDRQNAQSQAPTSKERFESAATGAAQQYVLEQLKLELSGVRKYLSSVAERAGIEERAMFDSRFETERYPWKTDYILSLGDKTVILVHDQVDPDGSPILSKHNQETGENEIIAKRFPLGNADDLAQALAGKAPLDFSAAKNFVTKSFLETLSEENRLKFRQAEDLMRAEATAWEAKADLTPGR